LVSFQRGISEYFLLEGLYIDVKVKNLFVDFMVEAEAYVVEALVVEVDVSKVFDVNTKFDDAVKRHGKDKNTIIFI